MKFRLLLFFNVFLLVKSDLLRHCSNSSICQNGSQCYLSSTLENSAKCSTPNSHFSDTDQTCLTLIKNSKTFELAQKECQLKNPQAHLIWLLSSQKLEWVRDELVKDAFDGIWLGAEWHGELRWTPNGRTIVELKHYDVVGRNSENDEGKCLQRNALQLNDALDASTVDTESKCAVFYSINGQHKITMEPCDQQHSFICESPIDLFEDNQKWYAQCQCLNGFAGRYCEWKKEEDEAYDRIRCANESLKAICKEDDGTLVVDYAIYGHSKELSQNTCQSNLSSKSDCVDSSALKILMNKCQGRKICRIGRISDLFESSTCKGEGLGLHHRMRCSNEPETQCPNGTLFVKERCYEFSDSRIKKSYIDARLYCERKGGELAHFNKEVGFSQLLSKLQPLPDSEYWLHNSTTNELPLIGPRRPECISSSWWSPNFLSQLPCYAKLGWICEMIPSGFGASRLLDVPRLIEESESEPTKKCPTFEWNGQSVSETEECQEVEVNCPTNLEGKATFKCQCEELKWTEKPDLSQCVSQSVWPLKGLVATAQEPLHLMRRFRDEIKQLVRNGKISSGDIVLFVDSAELLLTKAHQRLLDPKRTSGWKENFGREISKSIGGAGDHLLEEGSKSAWMQLTDEQRIDKAARLMTLLQNMLVILGSGKEVGSNASVHFQNYEGYIQLTAPLQTQFNSPMMINRMVQTQKSASILEPEISEKIEFRTGNKMQLPSVDFLSSLAPRFSTPSMFMTHNSHTNNINHSEVFDPNLDPEPIKIGYFTFSKLGQFMSNSTSNKRLNSDIIGAFVNDAVLSVNLDEQLPANFTFRHLLTEGVSNPTCVYWNVLESKWSKDGCKLLITNKTQTQCSCTHLTSFAILMDFTDSLAIYGGQQGMPKGWQTRVLDFLTKVGCAISIVCLMACVIVFTMFRTLYNTRTTIHRNLCLCLLFGELLFLFGIDYTQNETICSAIAVGLHYFFVCAFAWMLLEGYQLYLMLIKVFEANRTQIIYYYIVGYLLPALLVALSYLFTPENYGTVDYCWINVRSKTIYAFVCPITAIIIFNSGVLFVALRTVLSVQNRDRSLAERVLGWLKGSAMLLCLLGTTWAFGFLSAIHFVQPLFAYIFTILNSLQGMFIFILHVIMNEKTRKVVFKCLRGGLCCGSQLVDSSQQSSSYNQQNRSNNNFFSLNKMLKWWPLKTGKSTSSDASQSQTSQKQQSDHIEVHFKPSIQFVDDDKVEEMEEEHKITRKRLLSPTPINRVHHQNNNITIERF